MIERSDRIIRAADRVRRSAIFAIAVGHSGDAVSGGQKTGGPGDEHPAARCGLVEEESYQPVRVGD